MQNNPSINQKQYLRSGGLVTALLLALAVWLVWPAATAYAQTPTITVNTTVDELGSGSGCSLREAVQAANENANYGGCTRTASSGDDIISLPAGTYLLTRFGANEDLNLLGDLDHTGISRLTIIGAGAASTIIDANGLDRAIEGINGSGPLAIEGVTIQNGNVTGSGDAGTGGGIRAATLTLTNTNILSNTASGSGGGVRSYATATVTGGVIRNNRSGGSGGGIYGEVGGIVISGTQVLSNSANRLGGGMW